MRQINRYGLIINAEKPYPKCMGKSYQMICKKNELTGKK